MSLKVSLSIEVSNAKSFPKLMADGDGLIILFSSNRVGVIVMADACTNIGYYDDNWCMTDFKDYEGELTLKNE